MKKNRVTLLKAAIALSLLICYANETVKACNETDITLASPPINNGNGTFTIAVNVCIATTISFGGTTSFSVMPVGGNFSSIASFTPITLTNSYNYCSQCSGVPPTAFCAGTMTSVTTTAVGTLNGPNTAI